MAKDPITKDQVLEKFESICQGAFEEGELSVALRAADTKAKILGIFMKPKRLPDIVRIADMSDQQLSEFITHLEENNPALKDLKLPPLETDKKDE